MKAPVAASRRVDVAFDRRITSHMSAGMALYVRKLIEQLPRVAPDLALAFVGEGDNFDVAEQAGLPLAIARCRPRLVHLPSPFVPLIVPSPYVVTIHDLIDLHYPQFGKRKVGPYYRFGVGPVARRARAVITDDRRTADDLVDLLGVDPDRIRVVPLGVDFPPEPRPQPLAGRPYFLYVGNHRGHKNLETLVRAWATLPEALAVDLRLTGSDDRGFASAPRRANGELLFSGELSDDSLRSLYRHARAYVHPAFREGFGLPMLEAMRAGAPVIAARTAVPDVLAPYVSPFDPTDVAALRALLERALVDPASLASAAQIGQAATRDLTWARTAAATAEIYREFCT